MIHLNVEAHNVETLEPADRGWWLGRLPANVREAVGETTWAVSRGGTGVELRFNLNRGKAKITLVRDSQKPVNPVGVAEIWYGPYPGDWQVSPRFVGPRTTVIEVSRPDNPEELQRAARALGSPWDPALVRVFLPYDYSCRLLSVTGDVEPPRPGQVPAKRLLVYGSSITHGGAAVRPSGTWPRLAAEALGVDLINWGLSGRCRLEPALAEALGARTDWSVALVELGVNVIGDWDAATFGRNVDAFLGALARGLNGRPVWCTDVFRQGRDLAGDPLVAAYRREVRRAVETLAAPGLRYVSGLDLLPSLRGMTTSQLHPSALGQADLAAEVVRLLSSPSAS